MCILTPHDDVSAPSLRDKVEGAFARLDKAHAAVLRLAQRLDDGDNADDFPGLDPDHHIRRVLGQMHSARYEADAALCSLMYGETYRPLPTQPAMGVEMQARLHRNSRPPRPSSALRRVTTRCRMPARSAAVCEECLGRFDPQDVQHIPMVGTYTVCPTCWGFNVLGWIKPHGRSTPKSE